MTSIVGTWRLVHAEAFDANGKPQPAPYGGAPIGRVMFTSSGRMMAMTGDGRQEAHADHVREYNTYAGAYTFDGKRLITRVDFLLQSCLYGHRASARGQPRGRADGAAAASARLRGSPARAARPLLGEDFGY